MSVATLEDYEARYGTPANPQQVTQQLADAGSLIEQIANRTFTPTTETIQIEGGGNNIVFLPNPPVTAVTAVTVDGTVLTSDQYDWWPYGMLRTAMLIPNDPRAVTVTYSHGDGAPDRLVALACTMVERSRVQVVQGSVRQESFVDAYSVTYSGTSGLVGLQVDEAAHVAALGRS